MRTDPKSAKKTVKLSVFFVLSGSELAKSVRGTLLKLTPGLMSLSYFLSLVNLSLSPSALMINNHHQIMMVQFRGTSKMFKFMRVSLYCKIDSRLSHSVNVN